MVVIYVIWQWMQAARARWLWFADWIMAKRGDTLDVILHVGAHRTATTSFQKFMNGNAAALKRAGIDYWGPEHTRNGLFSGLIGSAARATPDADRRAYRACGVIKTALLIAEHAGTRHFVVSEPNMLGNQMRCLSGGQLYPDARARLARFRTGFGAKVTRVVLSIRSYETWWASVMARALPLGAAFPTAATLDRLVTQPRRWRDVVADCVAIFPDAEILVWPFERLASQPERQLALMTGEVLPAPLHRVDDWLRVSPTRGTLCEVMQDRGEPWARDLIGTGDSRWTPFPDLHRATLRAAYGEDLNWLANAAAPQVTFVGDTGRAAPATDDQRGQENDQEGQLGNAGRR